MRLQRREDIEGELPVHDVEAGGFRGVWAEDLSEHFYRFPASHTFVLCHNCRIKELWHILLIVNNMDINSDSVSSEFQIPGFVCKC